MPRRPRLFATAQARRALWIGLTAAVLLAAAYQASVYLPVAFTYEGGAAAAMDLRTYLMRTEDVLAGGSFYRDRQLTGKPYVIATDDGLYPPTLLYLTVPFALGLPAILWWLIPVAIMAAALWRIRPPLWTWALMAAVLLFPRTTLVLVLGNPAMWAVAFAFAGVAWGWPAALVVLKPTLAPFALLGVRRSWWLALGALALLSLPLLSLWLDYATALLNARNPWGLDYVLGEWPVMAAPLVAWLGSRRPRFLGKPVDDRRAR